jgi:hypothetical protein
MKVIKRVEPKPKVYRVTCSCGSELEYEPKDIHADQRDGPYIICPVCNNWIGTERNQDYYR